MSEALQALVGKEAAGLSAAVVSRLKARWGQEYDLWRRQPLGKDLWVYLWADLGWLSGWPFLHFWGALYRRSAGRYMGRGALSAIRRYTSAICVAIMPR